MCSSDLYSVMYKRWHLIGLEVGMSVASVGLRKEPTGCPIGFHADVIATANPGCLLQIAAAGRRAGHDWQIVHPIELIDASIKGESMASPQRRGPGRARQGDA